jgi:hypothetical protein
MAFTRMKLPLVDGVKEKWVRARTFVTLNGSLLQSQGRANKLQATITGQIRFRQRL